MFEIFLQAERKLVDTSLLSTQEKLEMKKLFYQGEQLAKKRKESNAELSDLVIAKMSSSASDDSIAETESDSFAETDSDSAFFETASVTCGQSSGKNQATSSGGGGKA